MRSSSRRREVLDAREAANAGKRGGADDVAVQREALELREVERRRGRTKERLRERRHPDRDLALVRGRKGAVAGEAERDDELAQRCWETREVLEDAGVVRDTAEDDRAEAVLHAREDIAKRRSRAGRHVESQGKQRERAGSEVDGWVAQKRCASRRRRRTLR